MNNEGNGSGFKEIETSYVKEFDDEKKKKKCKTRGRIENHQPPHKIDNEKKKR